MSQSEVSDFRPTADVGAERVARVYAEALLNAAEKQGQAADVLEDLNALLGEVFEREPHLEQFLSSGAIGRDRKDHVLRATFENRAGTLFTDFLLVLNQHDRLDLLRPIRDALRGLYDERSRRIRVLVRSAVPLPDDQRSRLQQQLRETFEQEPMLHTQVDPNLLGGIVVRVGDWLYDGSVRTQIDNLRNQLIASSSYEIQSGRDRFSSPIGN